MDSGENGIRQENKTKSVDLEKLLEERERLDSLIKKKFTKTITIMFTDMKGSTSIAELEGDVYSRLLIKKCCDIIFPAIENNKGVLVKTMGDGTLSYFNNASDAVRAAVKIQKELDAFNLTKITKTPILIRIGINTGIGIVEKNDIYGDVVNVASRFESLAGSGEIYISKFTFDALDDHSEFYCQLVKKTELKEKKGIYEIYKVFWNEEEIERDKSRTSVVDEARAGTEKLTRYDRYVLGRLTPDYEKEADSDEMIVLQKFKNLEKNKELVELYLFCHQFNHMKVLNGIYENLRSEFESQKKIETKLDGEKAIWFFNDAITLGRFQEADFPITNKAMSRVPIKLGMRNGDGFLEIESRGIQDIKSIELEKYLENDTSKKDNVRPDMQYSLGKSGKIIFSVCFPFEFNVYRGRFLTLRILNPEVCLKKHFNFKLRDVWKDFEIESEKILVIGT